MPSIPQYQQQTMAGGQVSAHANPADFGAQSAAAGARLGDAIGNVASATAYADNVADQKLKAQEEKDARSWTGLAISQATLDWSQDLQKRKDSALPGAPDFYPSFIANYDKYFGELVDKAPSAPAKDFVRAHGAALRTQLGNQAMEFEAQAQRVLRVDNATGSIKNAAIVVAQDRRQFPGMLAMIRETLPAVGPEQQARLSEAARAELVQAAATGAAMTDPAGTYELISRSLHPFTTQPTAAGEAPSVAGSNPERGLRNNNPGNIRKSAKPWLGETQGGDPSFSTFATPEAGIRALGKNLIAYQEGHGIDTISGIISRWAPATENNTPAYVAAVSKQTGFSPDAKLDLRDPATLTKLTTAIIKHETGKQPYGDATIKAGVDAALGGQMNVPAPTGKRPLPSMPAPGQTPDGEPVKTGVPWVDNMTVPERLHFMQMAATEQQRGLSTLQTRLRAQEKDLASMAQNGVAPPPASVPSEKDYIAAYGQVDGPFHYRDNVVDIVRVGEGIKAMQTASPEERQGLIAASRPVPGQGFAHQEQLQTALIKAKDIVERQIEADPAAYATQNAPRVQAAAKAAFSENGSPGAMQAYTDAMTAEQTRLGVKPTEVRLLSKPQADAIVTQFYSQDKGGAHAAELISSLETQFGAAWPQVYAQLAKDDKLPASALVIPNMSDAGAKARMAAASVVKPAVFKEQMAASDPKDIRDSLLTQFDGARSTFAAQGVDGVGTLTKVMQQAENLAYYYRVQGKSPTDAAKQAFTETMGWKYEFNGSYRVPKTEQPREVVRGAEATLRKLDPAGLQVIAAPGVPMSDANKAALTADAIKANAQWVTSGDEAGLRLMVQGKDGALYQVRDKGGEPVTMDWNALRDRGIAAAKARDEQVQHTRPLLDALSGDERDRAQALQEADARDRARRLREAGMR